MAQALLATPALHNLLLCGNDIGDAGAEMLAEACSLKKTGLKLLGLSSNEGIGPVGTTALKTIDPDITLLSPTYMDEEKHEDDDMAGKRM